jgi:hypothetical protein
VEHGKRRDDEFRVHLSHLPSQSGTETTHADCDYHFAACNHREILPLIEGLPRLLMRVLPSGLHKLTLVSSPRDVFTSCMTSPVLMALRFYYLTDSLRLSPNTRIGLPDLTLQDLLEIPGELHDRETVSAFDRAAERSRQANPRMASLTAAGRAALESDGDYRKYRLADVAGGNVPQDVPQQPSLSWVVQRLHSCASSP